MLRSSSSTIFVIMLVSRRMPPSSGTAPPTRPVPLPRTVTGMPCSNAYFITAEISAVDFTRTLASGRLKAPPSSSWQKSSPMSSRAVTRASPQIPRSAARSAASKALYFISPPPSFR